MVFITLWDSFGSIDIVIRPQIYQKFRQIIDQYSFICCDGKLQIVGKAKTLLVERMLEPTLNKAQVIKLKRKTMPNQVDFSQSRSYF